MLKVGSGDDNFLETNLFYSSSFCSTLRYKMPISSLHYITLLRQPRSYLCPVGSSYDDPPPLASSPSSVTKEAPHWPGSQSAAHFESSQAEIVGRLHVVAVSSGWISHHHPHLTTPSPTITCSTNSNTQIRETLIRPGQSRKTIKRIFRLKDFLLE